MLLLLFFSFLTFNLKSFLLNPNLINPKNLQASLIDFDLLDSFTFFEQINRQEKNNFFIDPAKISLIESPELLFIEENSLKAVAVPNLITTQSLGILVGEEESEYSFLDKEITEYIVQSGDTLSFIALKFDVSSDTIIWANDLVNSKIKPGQSLIILPVSGVIHCVKEKESLSGIAKNYKGDIDKVIAFNELSNENDIYIGDILIIPGGVISKQVAATKKTTSNQVAITSGYFIVPVPSPYIITQGLHSYNAIDFGHLGSSCGKPIYAAAGGIIQKIGYDRTSGNYIRILHSNNVVTFYGHLSSIAVKGGNAVGVGDIIGRIGNTGHTIGRTGCHLHFEVRGAANPFAR